jgi:hypothetical protein
MADLLFRFDQMSFGNADDFFAGTGATGSHLQN